MPRQVRQKALPSPGARALQAASEVDWPDPIAWSGQQFSKPRFRRAEAMI
jgi:hypothetical protein